MNDWGSIVGGAAAVVAAALAVVSANWTTKNRHASTKEALDIRDRLEGEQRDAWESVVQRHLDAELRRVAGPSPFAAGCALFVIGYVVNLASLALSHAGFDGMVADAMLPFIGLVFTIMGGLVFTITTWKSLRGWLKESAMRRRDPRQASNAPAASGTIEPAPSKGATAVTPAAVSQL